MPAVSRASVRRSLPARSCTSATDTPTAAPRSLPTACSLPAAWRRISTSRELRSSISTTSTRSARRSRARSRGLMPLLALPEPYDFELSTARSALRPRPREPLARRHPPPSRRRRRGSDHRRAGRRGRRAARRRDRAGRTQAARRRVRSGRLLRLRRHRACSRPARRGDAATAAARRQAFIRTIVTSVTAQQVSLYAAFAIRNRLIERLASVPSTRTHSPPASAWPSPSRTRSPQSASRAARRST